MKLLKIKSQIKSALVPMLAVAGLGVLASCSCSRAIEDEEEPELLEHRVEDCRRFCEVRSSECGPSPEHFNVLTVDECVIKCASPEGSFSWQWGHRVETGEDECIAEWRTHAQCLISASCEEQQEYWLPTPGDPPLEERVCWEERDARDLCAVPGRQD